MQGHQAQALLQQERRPRMHAMLLPVRQSAATGGVDEWCELHPLLAAPALHPSLHMVPVPQIALCTIALLGSVLQWRVDATEAPQPRFWGSAGRASSLGTSCWRPETALLEAGAGRHIDHLQYQLIAWGPQRAALVSAAVSNTEQPGVGVHRHAPLLEAAAGLEHEVHRLHTCPGLAGASNNVPRYCCCWSERTERSHAAKATPCSALQAALWRLKAAAQSPGCCRELGILAVLLLRAAYTLTAAAECTHTLGPPLQENADRLKAYKSKLVVFPRNKKKVKQGDSSSEEQQAAAQLTGRVLPLVHEKPAVEFVTISDEMKVGWLQKHSHT